MDPVHLALLLAAGLGAGFCNAIAGGGSLLSFPALLALGLPPVTATVTNSVAVWPGYLGVRPRCASAPRTTGHCCRGSS